MSTTDELTARLPDELVDPFARGTLSLPAVQAIELAHRELHGLSLLQVADALEARDDEGLSLLWASLLHRETPLASDWPAADVVPFLRHHLDVVLAPPPRDFRLDQARVYALLGLVDLTDDPPTALVDHLYAVALGTAKTHRDRDAARALLAGHHARTSRAKQALSDSSAPARAVAAGWLARIADPDTLVALEAALDVESDDVARAALLGALETFGVPIGPYLDRAALEEQAAHAARRAVPRLIAWLDWDRAPVVRWRDGPVVPAEVVRFLVHQAARAKSAEPTAVLRGFVSTMERADRERLASWVLDAWLDRPDGRGADFVGIGQVHTAVSATEGKGVLAVVAAAGGAAVAGPADAYLNRHYGNRPHECRAVVSMLAWVDHPTATQVVLSVAAGFRTRSIQQEAAHQVTLLAGRRGWTLDDLADRSVPTAGFDADGILPVVLGGRTVTARLAPDLTVTLHDAEGRTVRSLPRPRVDDDPALFTAARALLKTARRDVEAVRRHQTVRLQAAMCRQRTWTAPDWQVRFLGHPVLSRLASRLVWTTTGPDGAHTTFRVLDDASLTDVYDEVVSLAADGVVGLAHEHVLEPGVAASWLAHLADYDVDPPFAQIGRRPVRLAPEQRTDVELLDHRGHVIDSFLLRTAALAAGWTLGPVAPDRTWFPTWQRRYDGLDLSAVLTFTGSRFDENHATALLSLSFTTGRGPTPLGDVPPVVLWEAWNDVADLAALGTGHDPDWERITES